MKLFSQSDFDFMKELLPKNIISHMGTRPNGTIMCKNRGREVQWTRDLRT